MEGGSLCIPCVSEMEMNSERERAAVYLLRGGKGRREEREAVKTIGNYEYFHIFFGQFHTGGSR